MPDASKLKFNSLKLERTAVPFERIILPTKNNATAESGQPIANLKIDNNENRL